MHYALLYLDTYHRLRIFAEGGCNLEKRVDGIGWCLEADQAAYRGEREAFTELARLCLKHAENYPGTRIEVDEEDYKATHEPPYW